MSYKYRLYPNDEQEARLKSALARLCDVYNELKEREGEQIQRK